MTVRTQEEEGPPGPDSRVDGSRKFDSHLLHHAFRQVRAVADASKGLTAPSPSFKQAFAIYGCTSDWYPRLG